MSTRKSGRKRRSAFETLSTFFFEKKVAKKQKSLLDLSGFVSAKNGMKLLASPRTNFHSYLAKIVRNSPFEQSENFALFAQSK
ncbi:MAG: hypothetical protein IJW21_07420, partial [Clostridia bacterium]|nr:hypothetical protein [Clostridia bacterium]